MLTMMARRTSSRTEDAKGRRQRPIRRSNDRYVVTLPGHDVLLFPSRDDLSGLYVFTPAEEHLHVTAKERLKIYKKRDQKKVIEARMLVPNLGFPSDKDYASLLNNNLANNMPVSVADVHRANRIVGKDIPSCMDKTIN